ncbi:MAG: type II secretion system F family protein [Burkholderiaceae bacterium]|nr:type II secretion system F family protein [Burkholderiaceae bacterium]
MTSGAGGGFYALVVCTSAVAVAGAMYVLLVWGSGAHARAWHRPVEAAAHIVASRRLPTLWRWAWPLLLRGERHCGRWLPVSEGSAALLAASGLAPMVTHAHLALAQCFASGAASLFAAAVWMLALPSGHPMLAWASCTSAALWGASAPVFWLRRRRVARVAEVERELPLVLDLLALCVQGGSSTQGALHTCAQVGPPGVLQAEICHMLSELRTGVARDQAYLDLARRLPSASVRAWVDAMSQSARMGTSLGDALRELAEAQHDARFERAERLAMLAPVKLLVPLVLCIFPCTFLVIGFPILMTMIEGSQ